MDALLVIDMQKDFMAGGALPVPGAGLLLQPINTMFYCFAKQRAPIFLSRCWHPANHISFKSWPRHCVQDTAGAEFADGLAVPEDALVISKGVAVDQEGYSAFENTDLLASLRAKRIKRLFLGGVAMEYCVYHTAKDALRHAFEVILLTDCIAGLNTQAIQEKETELKKQGIQCMESRLVPC